MSSLNHIDFLFIEEKIIRLEFVAAAAEIAFDFRIGAFFKKFFQIFFAQHGHGAAHTFFAAAALPARFDSECKNTFAGVEIFQPIQSDLFNKMDKAAEDGQKAANQAIDKYSEKASGYLDKAEKKATEFVGDDKELQKAVKDLRQEGEKLLKDGNVDLKKRVDDLRKLF